MKQKECKQLRNVCGVQRRKCRTLLYGDYKEKEYQEPTSISDKTVRRENQQNSRSFISS
jgi:hypothetical protein